MKTANIFKMKAGIIYSLFNPSVISELCKKTNLGIIHCVQSSLILGLDYMCVCS